MHIKKYQTWYGEIELSPVIQEILETKELKRLGKINQYGAIYQLYNQFRTTRLEHSIGVFAFLQKLGASVEEQIAGLIHDISHTAFSHVIDFVLGDLRTGESYHEDIAESFLESSEVLQVLKKYNIDEKKVLEYEHGPSLLERDYPDLCADRFDYILRDLEVFNIISEEDIHTIIQSLEVHEGTMTFNNVEVASYMSKKMIEGNIKVWNSPYQIFLAKSLSDIVRISLEKEYITKGDLLGTDNHMFRTLQAIDDVDIQNLFKNLTKEVVVTNNPEDYSMHVFTKARIIDPLVCVDGKCQRISVLDEDFVQQRKAFLETHDKGYFLNIREREEGEHIKN